MNTIRTSIERLAANVDLPRASSAPQRKTDAVAGGKDEVSLSPVVAHALSDRSNRISALKAQVDSQQYEVPARLVSEKLVANAVSESAPKSLPD